MSPFQSLFHLKKLQTTLPFTCMRLFRLFWIQQATTMTIRIKTTPGEDGRQKPFVKKKRKKKWNPFHCDVRCINGYSIERDTETKKDVRTGSATHKNPGINAQQLIRKNKALRRKEEETNTFNKFFSFSILNPTGRTPSEAAVTTRQQWLLHTSLHAVLLDGYAGLRADLVGSSAAEGVSFEPFETTGFHNLTCNLFQHLVILEPFKVEIRLGKHTIKGAD